MTMNKHDFTDRLKEIKRGVRAEVTGIAAVADAWESALADYGREPSAAHLEHAGRMFDYLAENIERQQAEWAAKSRTREEWVELERQWVEDTTRISREDVHDYLMTALEAARDHYRRLPAGEMKDAALRRVARLCAEYEATMRQLRPCGYVFCGGVLAEIGEGGLSLGHGNARYCCDKHREAQRNAERRFEATSKRYKAGTYLPQHAYIPKRGASVEEAYQARVTVGGEKRQNWLKNIDSASIPTRKCTVKVA
ncbi:MAG TPA: hypothetical protein VFV52_07250 [Bacilli bacterium]|nr:hypothetical protein [Bacilli bacterium]